MKSWNYKLRVLRCFLRHNYSASCEDMGESDSVGGPDSFIPYLFASITSPCGANNNTDHQDKQAYLKHLKQPNIIS